jgi:hypothetical protein
MNAGTFIELHIPNFEIAKEFYGNIGYKVVWEKQPNEREGYMVMQSSDSVLNFYCGNEMVYDQTYFKRFPSTTPRGYAVEIVILKDDIETFYKVYEQLYPDSIVEPIKKRFSHPDFRVVDPFGFYLRFVERYDWVNGRDKNGNPVHE